MEKYFAGYAHLECDGLCEVEILAWQTTVMAASVFLMMGFFGRYVSG